MKKYKIIYSIPIFPEPNKFGFDSTEISTFKLLKEKNDKYYRYLQYGFILISSFTLTILNIDLIQKDTSFLSFPINFLLLWTWFCIPCFFLEILFFELIERLMRRLLFKKEEIIILKKYNSFEFNKYRDFLQKYESEKKDFIHKCTENLSYVITFYGKENLMSILKIARGNLEEIHSEIEKTLRLNISKIRSFKLNEKLLEEMLNLNFEDFDKKTKIELDKGSAYIFTEYINLILRNSEDEFRRINGLPRIGEGYLRETELFYNLKKEFSGLTIIHQAQPKWLGKQTFDIYFPDYKIAIEYQGEQHFKPIDYFGGVSGFKKTIERDTRKKEICEINNCFLIEVFPGYTFEEVKCKILFALRNQNQITQNGD